MLRLLYKSITNCTKGQSTVISGNRGGVTQIGDIIHKEKNQKKYNKTTRQIDDSKKYGKGVDSSIDNSKLNKQLAREARFMKNIHIENAYESLLKMNVIPKDEYRDWYFKCLHTLGVTYVLAQAEISLKKSRDPQNPRPLFHFLINKAMNKATDPFMPRVND